MGCRRQSKLAVYDCGELAAESHSNTPRLSVRAADTQSSYPVTRSLGYVASLSVIDGPILRQRCLDARGDFGYAVPSDVT